MCNRPYNMTPKNNLSQFSFLDNIFYLLIILIVGIYINEKRTIYLNEKRISIFAAENPEHPINDLLEINVALQEFHSKYGHYPKSNGFSGIINCRRKSSREWIKGLVPEFMSYLPNNLARSKNCREQYLYRSNKKDYKLIHHKPMDCQEVYNKIPSVIDPRRVCWAYGFWTKNAKYF